MFSFANSTWPAASEVDDDRVRSYRAVECARVELAHPTEF